MSVQYSLSEEKSNNSVKFVKSATKPARRRDDDYVQPQEHSFLETGASLDDIEKKIAEWIQNEVLLRILAHGIQEETDLEQHDAPPSVAVAPPKLSQILEKKIVLETSTQASFMLDMGVQVDKLSESTESSVPQKEEATVTVPAPIVPSAEIAIESLVLESKAIADSIHKNDLEDRLWAKLKHEAEEREKFLKSLEDQRRLDQEERKRLMDEAAKERKRLMEEIRRMQQQAETESEHETEDKIDSFIVWQEKLETTLAQLVPGPSPVKVIQTQEIQTVAPVPVVADQSMQTDVPAIVEASAQKVAVTPDPPLKKTIVMHKEETAQVIIKQEEPAKRRPTLIHLGEEKVIYEDVSQVAEVTPLFLQG